MHHPLVGAYHVRVSSIQVSFWQREAHYPSEPIFVPRPGSTQEDDGVVLTLVRGPETPDQEVIVNDIGAS